MSFKLNSFVTSSLELNVIQARTQEQLKSIENSFEIHFKQASRRVFQQTRNCEIEKRRERILLKSFIWALHGLLSEQHLNCIEKRGK